MPLAQELTTFTTTSPIIASYDYNDIQTGIFENVYYICETEGATTDNILTDKNLYSSEALFTITGGGSRDVDFDLNPFKIPMTATGTAYFNTNAYISGGANSSVTVTVYKYDGSIETAISSAITVSNWSILAATSQMLLIPIPLTETLFAEGEVLRLRLQTAVTGVNLKLGQDPAGRTHGEVDITTQSKLIVPFKLDR